MRLKGGEYRSYKTHNYCKRCELWQDKIGIHCISCAYLLRKKPRKRNRDVKQQWARAI